MNYELLMK